MASVGGCLLCGFLSDGCLPLGLCSCRVLLSCCRWLCSLVVGACGRSGCVPLVCGCSWGLGCCLLSCVVAVGRLLLCLLLVAFVAVGGWLVGAGVRFRNHAGRVLLLHVVALPAVSLVLVVFVAVGCDPLVRVAAVTVAGSAGCGCQFLFLNLILIVFFDFVFHFQFSFSFFIFESKNKGK